MAVHRAKNITSGKKQAHRARAKGLTARVVKGKDGVCRVYVTRK